MRIKPLSLVPEKKQQLLELIHREFQYPQKHSFEVDFHPLMARRNWENLFLLLDGEVIVGHIGLCHRRLKVRQKSFPIVLLGGICMHRDYQGKGLFPDFMNTVLAKAKGDNAFLMLFSDKPDLYQKFGFHLAFSQFQIPCHPQAGPEHLMEIAPDQQSELHRQLFEDIDSNRLFTLERTDRHWEEIEKMSSMKRYFWKTEEGRILYALVNKGADLEGIIHESNLEAGTLISLPQANELWHPVLDDSVGDHRHDCLVSYTALVKIADMKTLSGLCSEVHQRSIDLKMQGDKVSCSIDNVTHLLPPAEFIQGVFGPRYLKQLGTPQGQFYFFGTDSV